MKSTLLSRKLARQLIADGLLHGFEEQYYIQRIYAGHWQRSAGAWSFELLSLPEYTTCDYFMVGSQYPASELAKSGFTAEFDCFGSLVLDPIEPRKKED